MKEDIARDWREAIQKALEETTFDDVVIPYSEVVIAFPSANPRWNTFAHPSIDDIALRKWAGDLGWRVDLVPEEAPKSESALPDVRFRRLQESRDTAHLSPNKSLKCVPAFGLHRTRHSRAA